MEPAGPPAGSSVSPTVASAPAGGSSDALRARRIAELSVLGVIVLWGGNFIVVKVAIGELPPAVFAALRYSLASVVLLSLLRWREGTIRLPRRDLVRLAILGVIGYGFYQILWTTALQTVSAGDSALLIATTPVITGLVAAVVGTDTLTPTKLGGGLVAFVGVAIVIGGGVGFTVTGSLVGDLMTLGAAVCWAIYTSFGARFLVRLSALRTTAWAVAFGTLFVIPLGLFQLRGMSDPGPAIVGAAGAIVYAGVLAAGISNVVVFRAIRLLGPTRVTAFQFFIPAVTVVLAAIILDEPIRAAQIVGGVVIVVGVLLTRSRPSGWGGRRRDVSAAAP